MTQKSPKLRTSIDQRVSRFVLKLKSMTEGTLLSKICEIKLFSSTAQWSRGGGNLWWASCLRLHHQNKILRSPELLFSFCSILSFCLYAIHDFARILREETDYWHIWRLQSSLDDNWVKVSLVVLPGQHIFGYDGLIHWRVGRWRHVGKRDKGWIATRLWCLFIW